MREQGRDDEAWRAIVENYGERAELDDDPPPPAWAGPVHGPLAGLGGPGDTEGPVHPPERDVADPADPDRFVPPDPPLPPRPTRDRLAAWAGLLGAPLVVLVLVLTGTAVPPWVGLLLAAAFVGGFAYLVLHLPRSPEDPWDDGARV